MSSPSRRMANGGRQSLGNVARWALVSGIAGVIANVFLVLLYVVFQPWQEEYAGSSGWFGMANDSLVAVQFATLLPVVRGLGDRMPSDPRVRAWTRVGLTAAAAVVALQVLLVARIIPFEVQVIPVTLCIIVLFFWVGAISHAGERMHTLPKVLSRFGRFLSLGLPIGAGVFVVGVVVSWAANLGSSAWVIAALPGFVVWLLFPVWVLLLSRGAARS